MASLLVSNAMVLVTMDDARREIADGGLYAEDGLITAVGTADQLPATADIVLDATDHVVLPGLVNTHHHLYQTLTRAVPAAQDAGLFGWLQALYPVWSRLTPDDIQISTKVGLAELVLSGSTTVFDHLYLYPNGARLDDQVEAAMGIGVRLHVSRGSMSLGESQGGLPPDSIVEDEDDIISDTQRVIETYHDAGTGAMTRVVVAPCSPFSVTTDLMRESAQLARDFGVGLHTHLAETLDEERFCLETHNRRPVELAEDLGWEGHDVWYAHGVHISPEESRRMAAAGTGVAHCPSSNMRLASGIAPIRTYLEDGVRVSRGVDGSASNDSSHMLAEARQAMLLARLAAATGDGPLLPARRALALATRGGAEVLGRNDIGALEAGRCADFVAIDMHRLEYAGALHDPVAAILFCAPTRMDHVYVHGRPVVSGGRLATADEQALVAAHNRAADRLLAGNP